MAMADQEWGGGGRWNRGGKTAGTGDETGWETASTRDARATPAGTAAWAVAEAESNVETAGDSPAALSAGNAGSHGVEKPAEAPGALSGRVCVIAKLSATTSARPNAKFAHLRTINRWYIRTQEHAMVTEGLAHGRV